MDSISIPILGSFPVEAVGAYASIGSIVIALLGFSLTLFNVRKGRTAAQRAETAAKDAVGRLKLYDSVSGFSTAISILEEIKRLHRKDAWEVVIDRYAALKGILVEVRASNANLTQKQSTVVQKVITDLSTMENAVETEMARGGTPQEVPRFNEMLSKDIEKIQAVLAELKAFERELK